jgi:hypothetical protein
VLLGGRSLGSARHWQPVLKMYMIPLTSRTSTVRSAPPRLAGGITGATEGRLARCVLVDLRCEGAGRPRSARAELGGALLTQLLDRCQDGLRLSEHIADTDGAAVFRQVCAMGLRGSTVPQSILLRADEVIE